MDLEHLRISTNGISLHAVAAGPKDGPLLLLLHGFPELWYGWRKHIEPLAAEGFRVIAPDQRGYNLSDKPIGLGAYSLTELAQDITGIIDAQGREKAHIVGHDWGGAVAWAIGILYPDRVDRLVSVTLPHPKVMWDHLMSDPRQMKKTWYMLFFQLPLLPEKVLSIRGGELLAGAMVRVGRPGTFSAEELDRYREAWAQPGAMKAMLNWYRAGARRHPRPPRSLRVSVPLRLIWAAQDPLFVPELAHESLRLCDRGDLKVIEDGTHWVHHEQPERVRALILEHLRPTATTPAS